MKNCQCCGLVAPGDALTCSACGEASWVDLPAVKAPASPVKPGKGKASADLPGVG